MKHLKFLFGLFKIMTVLAHTSKALFLTFSTSSRLQTLRVGVRFVSSAINEPDYISKNVVIKKEELPAANNIVSKKPINNNNLKKDVNLEDNVKVKQKIILLEKDLDEKFVRGSGNGGQKINTTANRVQLTHIPTGISVSCQDARDLSTNRKIARKTLIDKLDLHFNGSDSKLGIAHEKIRKKKKNAKRFSILHAHMYSIFISICLYKHICIRASN